MPRNVSAATDARNRYPSIDSGELKHRITFLEQQVSSGIAGSQFTWAPGNPPLVVWAKLVPMRATDIIKAGQDVSKIWMQAIVRYRAEIQPNMRFQRANGKTFIIQAIENVLEMNVRLEMMCLGLGPNE